MVQIVEEKKPLAFTAQEVMKMGAVGPQIGQINKSIVGLSREEAFEVIKQILGKPDLTSKLEMSRNSIAELLATTGNFQHRSSLDSSFNRTSSITAITNP